jgi:REP element-mobilizing transposase RayT
MTHRYPGKPPRLSSVFDLFHAPVYFVTFYTFQRQRFLACDAVHTAFRRYMERGYAEFGVAVGRYVIIPDHVHLFVSETVDFNLGL